MKTILFTLSLTACITIILGLIAVPLLKKLKLGQVILGYVTEHKQKSGTPTMGGLFFCVAITIVFLIFKLPDYRLGITALCVSLSFMAVGFLDDFLKIKLTRNLGLRPYQKIIFQTAVSLITAFFAYRNGLDKIFIPFTDKLVSFGIWCIPLYVFVFIATVNSVNLTDGLDGLCGSVSAVYFAAFALLIYLQLNKFSSVYVLSDEYRNLLLLSVICVGALLGYLCFNVNKAAVFMGDTGSLAIGGFVSTISIFSGNVFYIPLIGITYALSSISVIMQVLHFKRTKKRIFLMAPLHHHFQEKGLTECKISYLYAFVTFIVSTLCLINLV